ncbi:DsbA family oxidoreductase [Pelomonas sp. KK5]|uniref:DsbA family oxidoreductase n=1 Tax=Pelomonas sp. KK5 TaxID=1855730 RepID=UPI00097C58AC|nr:DsbA family oxidoreductase [Pelomonas sp. KK5]
MKIDFVSDVSCPWCVIGLKSLEQALDKLPELKAELHFQPFELNPKMAAEGQDIEEHLTQKYGVTSAQMQASRENIHQRGAALGFTFDMGGRSRIYNTFDAHRLLHWAGTIGAAEQKALKMALFTAYFSEGKDPSDHETLVQTAAATGLDAAKAREVLAGDAYAREVREAEATWQQHGINSVPSVIIDDRHLIQGGQPPEVFERLLRQLAEQAA